MKALAKLAGPTKDLLFPIVRLQAWPRRKKTNPILVERSLEEYFGAMGERPAALDLASPRTDLDSETAEQGRDEITRLRNSAGGFRAWTDLLRSYEQFIPTVIWSDNAVALRAQVENLAAMNRGVLLRLRRSQAWNLAALASLNEISLENVSVLVLIDCEQITLRDDLTLIAQGAQNAALVARNVVRSSAMEFVIAGSSFPSNFASINPRTAKLDIRERQIYSLLKESPALVRSGVHLSYGDHASVYAAEREAQFRGSPRVDYPAPLTWVYHRRPPAEGYVAAARAIVSEPEWSEDLLCWGAQEIRRAAGGDDTGLGSASPWTAIRINVHLHQQAHFESGALRSIEEEWRD